MDSKTKERKRKVPSHFNKKSSKKKGKDDDAEMREDDNVDGEDEDDKETMLPLVQPITTDGDRPQKRFYRQRAHCNPLAHNDSYEYPVRPEAMVWQTEALYPTTALQDSQSGPCSPRPPTVLDIGCGFGGLTLSLASLLPNEVILGMEIRAKVTEYVRLRIVAARKDGFDGKTTEETPKTRGKHTKKNDTTQPERHRHHDYNNCAVMRTNSMKFLPNFFGKGSIRKLFFCFPDPHFKRKNHPRRIISRRLLDEYAYVLVCSSSSNDNGGESSADSDCNQGVNGRLYCITDVKELHDWHVAACDAHPSFRRLLVSTEATATTDTSNEKDEEDSFKESSDPCIHAMRFTTEEGQKVDRNGGSKYYAVYERIPHEQKGQRTSSSINASNFFAYPSP